MAHEGRHSAEKRVGTRLDGKWHLEAILGYGGSAAVYAATHRNGKRAAIKVLHRHCSEDEQLVARFVREGYLANKISHPGVVSILDDDVTDDGLVYLVMELLEGKSLDRCGRGLDPPLTIDEVIRVADGLLDALAVAHDLGLVHRDIKPANLFITTTGQLKILDFGIARLAEPSVEATQTGMMMGTPAFMPPEQARARWNEVDARSDIWSVGATLIALLLGRRPRVAETPNEELLMSMTQPLPSLTTLMPDAPAWLVKVIDKAVAFERADRWQSAREMQLALRAGAGMPASERFVARPPTPSMTIAMPDAPLRQPEPIVEETVAVPQPPIPPSSPLVTVVDPEPPQSLTTHRAVLQSQSPPPQTNAPRSSAGWIVAVVASFLLVAAVLGVVWSRSNIAFFSKRAAAAPSSPEPPSTQASPEVSATAEPPPEASASASSEPLPSASVATTASAREPHPTPKVAPRPVKPAGSDPSKYFDTRF